MGYAIECHLKFAVCDQNGWLRLPDEPQIINSVRFRDLYTHDWDVLVRAAQLHRGLSVQPKMNALYMELVEEWGPSLRYQSNLFDPADGTRLYKGLEELYLYFTEQVP